MPDIFLIRKSLQWVKFSNATAVALTGQVASYGSITGNSGTEVVTIPGLTCIDGMGVTFTSLTGGAGLSVGVKYYLVNSGISGGSTAKLATSQGGTAIDFTSDITTGTLLVQTDELKIWSGEFRDIFPATGINYQDSGVGLSTVIVGTMTGALMGSITPSSTAYGSDVIGPLTPTNSDEVGHVPLRQTLLSRTHWKITTSTGPSPLYATWADGDIFSNNPPETA